MRQYFTEYVVLLLGSSALLILCVVLDLLVNHFRSERIDLTMNLNNPISSRQYKRNELVYLQSIDIKATTVSTYRFVDTRPLSSYRKGHITGAVHYSNSDVRATCKPIVFYGQHNNNIHVKEVAMKMLLGMRQPAYILSDGLQGWKNNGLPVENQ